MSDAAIRSAERARQAEGLEEDKLRQLHEQVRGGALSMQTVTLAAAVGDPLAEKYVGGDPVVIYDRKSAERVSLPPRMAAWLGAGAARFVLPIWEAEFPDDNRPRRAIESAEAWVKDPTTDQAARWTAHVRARKVLREWQDTASARRSMGVSTKNAESLRWAVDAAVWSAWTTGSAAEWDFEQDIGRVVLSAVRARSLATTRLWESEASWAEVQAALIAQAWRWEEVLRG